MHASSEKRSNDYNDRLYSIDHNTSFLSFLKLLQGAVTLWAKREKK